MGEEITEINQNWLQDSIIDNYFEPQEESDQ